MKRILTFFLLLVLYAISNVQDSDAKTAPIQSFKAGGTPIVIPPPTTKMVEVGYDNREFMEVFVAPNNRLLAGFVLDTDISKLTNRSDDLMMTKYAMVQVPRRGEHIDFSAKDFRKMVDSAEKQFGKVMKSSMKEAEEEFNRRMKSLDLDEATVRLGEPIRLGCLFSKKDSYGFGMIMPYSMGGENIKMGMGGAFVRVKQRILFVYLYSKYEDEETVRWLRRTTEDWVDEILKANN